jgi:SAM-dependent methyltransferase
MPAGSVVLDPMAGSGTVVRVASELRHQALGFDLDPLAVLMARVWTTPVDVSATRQAASEIVAKLRAGPTRDIALPWIDDDLETRAYVHYWFAPPQRTLLRQLSAELRLLDGPIGDALRIAVSRIIITKDRGASLARDVSHSRPHRVRLDNDFPVLDQFARSVARLTRQLEDEPPSGNARVALGDARHLSSVATASVNAVISSPPYLNAIDYMRGHRLSLVWLGYRLSELRQIRAESIGTERGLTVDAAPDLVDALSTTHEAVACLPAAERRMIDRYVLDLHATVAELYRVIKPGGKAVLVVGNSCIRGVFVKNSDVLISLARRLGFTLGSQAERVLPPNRRYLPPPRELDSSDLEKRMRSETVLEFRR